MKKEILILTVVGCLVSNLIFSQKIFLDKYLEVAGVKVFQTVDNPNKYYYLSDQINIGKDKNGQPQVLFMKYAKNVSSKAEAEDITEGNGGGIFHALVNFTMPDFKIKQAEKALKKQNPKATIEGPITYKSGKVALISAIAGSNEKKIIGLGNAPTMEGNKTAVAFRLNKDDAILLWETFKTPVPDISFAFEMEMEGFLSPRKGYIKGNFERIHSSHEFSVAGGYPVYGVYLGADIGASFEKLRTKGVIEVYQEEGGQEFDEFLKLAYKQLVDIMFQRTTENRAHQTPQQDPLDRLQKLQNLFGGEKKEQQKTGQNNNATTSESKKANNNSDAPNLDKNNSTPKKNKEANAKRDTTTNSNGGGYSVFQIPDWVLKNLEIINAYKEKVDKTTAGTPSIMVTYRFKKSKQTGDFNINFNKVSAAQQFTSFSENIGNINCAACFQEVNLSIAHKAYDQREILYMIDGASESDFTDYINFVNVEFRKKHQSGEEEVDNKRIIRQAFKDNNNLFKVTYGYDKDTNLDKWLEYEYKTTWNFWGGYKIEEDWQTSTIGTVALKPPLEKRVVKIEADKSKLDTQLVRAIIVKLYDIRGENKPRELKLFSKQSGQIEYILPEDENQYEYEVIWMLDDEDNTVVESGRRKSSNSLLFVDRVKSN